MEVFMNVLTVILAIGAVALFVYVIVRSAFEWSRKSAMPVVNMHARVHSKRCEDIIGGKKGKMKAYFVTFENDGGDLKELRITPKEDSVITVGDGGTLTYRGDVLLSFEISRNEEAAEDENVKQD